MTFVRLLAGLMASIWFQTALADIPVPRVKPTVPNHTSLLSDHDFANLREGLQAIEDHDWQWARQVHTKISDPIAANLLLWRLAINDEEARFEDLDLALQNLEGWPQISRIQSHAERQISSSDLNPASVSAWFESNNPITGEGYVHWGEALIALGQIEDGQAKIIEGWRNKDMSRSAQSAVMKNHGHLFDRADHAARVDFLLWSGKRSSARRLLPKLSSGERRLAEARISLATRRSGVDRAISAVPKSLTDHPGLVYERAKWRRKKGRRYNNLDLLLELPNQHDNDKALKSMWTERKLKILTLIKNKDYITAYELASAHGMSSGVSFADAEFLSGWLALSFLKNAAIAYEHFETLELGVSTPVSLSRAKYWKGRAAEAQGTFETARSAFLSAAEYPTTYYGQLAVIALGSDVAQIALPHDPKPTEIERQNFNAREKIKALRLLAELNEDYYFRVFIYHLDDRMSTPVEQAMLTDIAMEYLQIRQAVRAAKSGRMQGMILAERAYPMVDIPQNAPIVPEAALTYSVIRQETEFDPRAVSSAGARGLMQMLPRTARSTARSLRVPYSFHWLTHDPQYNMKLGMAHLDTVVNEYDGSLIMALAAYNAGSHRVKTWVANYGDPRTGEIDPIDWVESIPFSETRNYVQRILENLQVYRARANLGQPTKIELETDMLGVQFKRDLPALPADFVNAVKSAQTLSEKSGTK